MPNFFSWCRYLYSRKAYLKDIEEALHCRAAARKYLVTQLVQGCTDYIQQKLDNSNVVSYLNYYAKTGEPDIDDVVKRALTLSEYTSLKLLSSKDLVLAEKYTIAYIL